MYPQADPVITPSETGIKSEEVKEAKPAETVEVKPDVQSVPEPTPNGVQPVEDKAKETVSSFQAKLYLYTETRKSYFNFRHLASVQVTVKIQSSFIDLTLES